MIVYISVAVEADDARDPDDVAAEFAATLREAGIVTKYEPRLNDVHDWADERRQLQWRQRKSIEYIRVVRPDLVAAYEAEHRAVLDEYYPAES